MIVSFPPGFIRSHLVCHFKFWDGPITGVAVLNRQHWYFERLGRVLRGCRYRLTLITLTAEIVRYLELYRRHWPHCFYCCGVRPQYDGRPCVPMGPNPIAKQAQHCTCPVLDGVQVTGSACLIHGLPTTTL